MKNQESKLREIYLRQMIEVLNRLNAALTFLGAYTKSESEIDFDSCVLQLRKGLEAVAYASIAPNKPGYQSFRMESETNNDFSKDFNATKIFQRGFNSEVQS